MYKPAPSNQYTPLFSLYYAFFTSFTAQPPLRYHHRLPCSVGKPSVGSGVREEGCEHNKG